MKTLPLAYSYVRFSTPQQGKGDSLRRQTEAAEAWCEKNGVRLDTTTTLHDLGRSAFTGAHRQNPDRHALAGFLKLVEAGKVPRGSYLVIENLDRLSREHIQPALLLALNLLQAGVRVVQLKPAEMVFDDKSDTLPVMMMMMELSRGHGESAIKSERLGKVWGEKKRKARESGTVLTHSLPAWVEESGGRLQLIPERAAVVKRIFQLAAAGYGRKTTVALFIREGVLAFGPAGHWNGSYVGAILKDRRAVGELQPRFRRTRKSDGAAIPGYYPAAVTEGEWAAARAGAEQRWRKPGRIGMYVNVFAGLLKDARGGSSYYCAAQHPAHGRGEKRRILISTAAHEGRAKSYSFPFDTFEAAVLSLLREVDPAEVAGKDDAPDEALVLSGELARAEASIALIEAELNEHGDSPTLFRRLREKEEKKRELADRLADARQRAATPLSEAWGQVGTLLAALEAAPDPQDARLRLRAVLRRVISEIRLLVVARGRLRVCAVQIWFADNGCRDYLIIHTPPKANKWGRGAEGGWQARSLKWPTRGKLDLRESKDAARLEKALAALDLDAD